MTSAGGAVLELLGRVAVHGPHGAVVEVGRPQVAAVLAMLWDEARPVRREELAELLWGDWNLPDHWAGAVRGVLAKVRRILDDAGLAADALQSAAGVVHLDLPPGSTTDLADAEALVVRAAQSSEVGDHAAALDDARRAAELLSRPVALIGEGDWLRRLQLRVDTYGRQARRTMIEALTATGRFTEAVAGAVDAIDRDPLDEVAHELLIETHLAAGRPVDARQAYAVLDDTLGDHLGVAPSPRARALLDGAVSPRPVPPAQPTVVPIGVDGSSDLFLGRAAELAHLEAVFTEAATTGTSRFVLVTGPAGIGKTRLVAQFTAAHADRVLWGRCHADAGEPFEPVAAALRHLVVTRGPLWSGLPAAARATLDGLTSQVADRPRAGARATRARVIRDVDRLVDALVETGPVVLVIDDLHWASGDTLDLAGRILEAVDRPLLVIATSRHELDEPAPVAELLRAAPSRVVELGVFSAADLLPLTDRLTALVDADVDATGLASALWERTGGLPYFLTEIARDAQRRRSLEMTRVPDQVRSWLRHRLDALPEELASLLEIAAVVGPQPSVAVIEACWEGPAPSTLRDLERLVRAGFLIETDRPDTLAFPHQITHEVVEEGLGAARRARLHARVAQLLADDVGDDEPNRHARIAHHLALAGPAHRLDAARHGYLAGVASLAGGAWDLADRQFTEALETLDDASPPDEAVLLVALGWTRHLRGEADQAAALLDRATESAARLGLPHEAARAALFLVGRGGRGAAYGMADAERVARLRRALAAVTTGAAPPVDLHTAMFPRDAPALATLQTAIEAELAWALLFSGTLEERTALVTGALARARAEDAPPNRLARALIAQRNVLAAPGQVPEATAVIDEVLALPGGAIGDELAINAWLARHELRLMVGDRAGARTALDTATDLVARYAHPYWRWATATWESLWLLVGGDPDAAEAALAGAATLLPEGSAEALACGAVQTVAIRLAQERADEVVDLVTASAAANPEIPCYLAVSALTRSLAGDVTGAKRAYATFARDDFATIPVDSNRLLTVAVLADVAADLGDARGAATLDALLAPDDDVMVVLNCYGGGGSWWGPVARIRARLADLLDHPDAAEDARRRAGRSLARLGGAICGQPGEVVLPGSADHAGDLLVTGADGAHR